MKRLAAAIVGAGMAFAGYAAPASADDDQLVYLQLLNLRGMIVYDTASALAAGYRACDALNYMTGDYVIPWMARNHVDMDYTGAAIVVFTAVETLCPWHDHRNLV